MQLILQGKLSLFIFNFKKYNMRFLTFYYCMWIMFQIWSKNMYWNTVLYEISLESVFVPWISVVLDDVQGQQDFDDFFEEVFTELEDKVT